MKRVLGFTDFFPNETPRPKDHYAIQLGKDILEKSTPFFLSLLRHKGNITVDALLKEWFTFNEFKYFQSPMYVSIEREYKRIKNYHPGEPHAIINVESLLTMFLWVRDNKAIPADVKGHDASITLPFLELILLFNDDVLKNYQKAVDSIKKYGDDRKIQRSILAGSFSQSDLVNIDYAQLFYTQIYKKAKLLEFLETTSYYNNLLQQLLNEFGCKSKEEFLKAIGSAVVTPLKAIEPSWSVLTTHSSKDKKKHAQILDNLAIAETDTFKIEQDDYLELRSKPFQKIKKGEYRVIFELFLIKKVYNGLIFKLSSYHKDFCGKIRDDFSEGVLVYDTLTNILKPTADVIITGNEFKKARLEREPDFYSRIENDLLLFESKDFFMPKEIKQSYDFDMIEGELMKDGRLKKAVKQLVKNIERCILKTLPLDNSYNVDLIKIFPEIIVHDSLYSAPALNYWVYYWFIDEIEHLKNDKRFKKFDFSKIIPVTIIEIDTLILYQDYFINKKLDLVDLIRRYHEYVRFDLKSDQLAPNEIEEHALKSAISFSEFARTYAHTLGIDINFSRISKMLKKFGIKQKS